MSATWWFVVFVALLLVLIVLALIARRRRLSELPPANPYASGEDPSPKDGEFGRDSDLDIDRRREADFDDDR